MTHSSSLPQTQRCMYTHTAMYVHVKWCTHPLTQVTDTHKHLIHTHACTWNHSLTYMHVHVHTHTSSHTHTAMYVHVKWPTYSSHISKHHMHVITHLHTCPPRHLQAHLYTCTQHCSHPYTIIYYRVQLSLTHWDSISQFLSTVA